MSFPLRSSPAWRVHCASLASLAALACSPLVGCTRAATQLVVVVDSDIEGLRCVRVEVGPADPGGEFEPTRVEVLRLGVARGASGEPLGMPFSLGVVPSPRDPRARVALRVSGYADCARADMGELANASVVRQVHTGFLPEQSLRLPVFLASRCAAATICDADADGVLDPGRTCDPATGTCEDTPFIDPGTLEPVTPGEELMGLGPDAGARDAGRVDDTGPMLDGGPPITGFGTRPTMPTGLMPRADASRASRVFLGDALGADGILVGGLTEASVALGDMMIPGDSFYLARLSASGATAWIASSAPAPFRATVQSALLLGTDILACVSLTGAFTIDGMTISSPRSSAVLLRLDAASGRLEAARHVTLDAAGSSSDVRCGGFVELGAETRVLVYASQDSGLDWTGMRVDGALVPLTGSPEPAGARASVLFAIDDAPGAMTVVRGVAISQGEAQIAGDGVGGAFIVAQAGAFRLDGLDGTSGPSGSLTNTVQRIDASGTAVWPAPMVVRGSSAGYLFPELATSGGHAWLLVLSRDISSSSRLSLPGSAGAITRSGPTGSTIMVAGRLSPTMAQIEGDVVDLPSTTSGITTDPAGNLYAAGHLVSGETPPISGTVPVVGSEDPFVVSFAPDQSERGVWQWSEGSEDQWGFREIVWLDGALVVNGYVREAGPVAGDDSSFLWVLPLGP